MRLETTRGRVLAILIGLMGGMIVAFPFRAPLFAGFHHCHERFDGCPFAHRHHRHHGGCPFAMPGDRLKGDTRAAPNAAPKAAPDRGAHVVEVELRHGEQIRLAPGVKARLQIELPPGDSTVPSTANRDPFKEPTRSP